MNETLTATYPQPRIGNYINRWYVVNKGTEHNGKVYHFKTESGALRMYEKLDRAVLFRETNCRLSDVRVMSK